MIVLLVFRAHRFMVIAMFMCPKMDSCLISTSSLFILEKLAYIITPSILTFYYNYPSHQTFYSYKAALVSYQYA